MCENYLCLRRLAEFIGTFLLIALFYFFVIFVICCFCQFHQPARRLSWACVDHISPMWCDYSYRVQCAMIPISWSTHAVTVCLSLVSVNTTIVLNRNAREKFNNLRRCDENRLSAGIHSLLSHNWADECRSHLPENNINTKKNGRFMPMCDTLKHQEDSVDL